MLFALLAALLLGAFMTLLAMASGSGTWTSTGTLRIIPALFLAAPISTARLRSVSSLLHQRRATRARLRVPAHEGVMGTLETLACLLLTSWLFEPVRKSKTRRDLGLSLPMGS